MKTFWIIAFALFVALMSVAEAARLPFIEDALKPQAGDEALEHPEPANLQLNWWNYFKAKGEELDRRIKETLARLESLQAELSPEMADAAHSYIELIKSNLQSLPQARAQPSPEPTQISFAKTYTLSRILEIADDLRKAQIQLQSEREDVAAFDKAFKAAQRRINTLTAAYLELAPSDPQRVLKGLEIMAERSSLALAEEQLRIRKASLLVTGARAKQLAEELSVAGDRLVVEKDDLARLNQEIEEAKKALEQAQEQAVNEQARALSVVSDDPEEQATARYRQQRAVRAAVMEAIGLAKLIKLRGQRHLVALVADEVELNTLALRQQLAEWKTQLASARQQTEIWTNASRRERERASDLMAGTVAESEGGMLTFIKLLNQDRLNLAQDTLLALQRLDGEINQAELIIRLVKDQLRAREGWIRDWLARAQQVLTRFWQEATGWTGVSLFTIGGAPVTAMGLLRIVLILFIAWLVSYWLRRVLKRFSERREGADLAGYYTVDRLSHYLIILFGLIIGLSSIGLDFTNFAVIAGLVSIGLGFGLQSIFNNFVSGLILLFDRSLKVGDFVELASGTKGEVRSINVRSTVIKTNENIDIVVPNSEFITGKVINWTLEEGYCRIHFPFKVAYGSDKELVRKAGLEAAEKVPHTLSGIPGRNPGVWLVGFGESSLNFELVVWVTPRAVKRPGAVKAAYMWELESALRKYRIEIPFPQRDLHLKGGFGCLPRSRPEPFSEAENTVRLYKEPS